LTVIEHGMVVGIVTETDMLRAFVATTAARAPGIPTR
jgi:CBS domain-containing protein